MLTKISFLWFCCCVGDITQKGYIKKKEQLEKKTEPQTEPQMSPTSTAIALRNATKQQDLKVKLGRLFGHTSKGASSSATCGFIPSAVGGKKSRKKSVVSVRSLSPQIKHITTIHLFERTAFVPRRSSREKLAKAGRIQDLKVQSSMTGEEIEAMIVNKFVTEKPCLSITYYKADKSDLVSIDPPIDGQELFEILGNGSLYIYIPQPQLPAPPDSCSISMPVPSDSCSISTPVPSDSCSISMPVPSDSSSPISMAAPSDDCLTSMLAPSDECLTSTPAPSNCSISMPAQHELSSETVEKQLTDPLVGQLWLEQADLIETNQEYDLDEVTIMHS